MKHLKLYENIFDTLSDTEEKQQRDKTQHQIIKLTNHIKYLRTTGDDSYVKQDIQTAQYKLRQLKDSLLSIKQQKQQQQTKDRATDKRRQKQMAQYDVQDIIEKRFQNQLSDRERAINTLVDLTYSLRHYGKTSPLFNNTKQSPHAKKQIKKVEQLKLQYNIKSYELKKSKLLKLDTNVLLNIHNIEEAFIKYSEILKQFGNKNNTHKENTLYRKQLADIIKFYSRAPFDSLYKY